MPILGCPNSSKFLPLAQPVCLCDDFHRDQLVQRFQWQEVSTDPRMLFSVQCNFQNMTLSLPLNATSFFSPGRLPVFQSAFQSEGFSSCRHSIPAVADILHLLQCLMPGLLTVVMVEQVPGQGTWTTSRGLPPVEWVDLNRDQLTSVFGREHYAHIRYASSTKTMSFATSCK